MKELLRINYILIIYNIFQPFQLISSHSIQGLECRSLCFQLPQAVEILIYAIVLLLLF